MHANMKQKLFTEKVLDSSNLFKLTTFFVHCSLSFRSFPFSLQYLMGQQSVALLKIKMRPTTQSIACETLEIRTKYMKIEIIWAIKNN